MSHSPRRRYNFLASKSTVLEKLPREVRAAVDRALVNRDPPTYRAIFQKFELNLFNISFSSFYAYGRRVRYEAALLDQAMAVAPSTHDAADIATRLLSMHLILLLQDEDPSPR